MELLSIHGRRAKIHRLTKWVDVPYNIITRKRDIKHGKSKNY